MRRWLIALSAFVVAAASTTAAGVAAPRARAGDAPIGHIGDTLRVDTGTYIADVTVSGVAPCDPPPGFGYTRSGVPVKSFPGSTVEANTAAPILLADGSRDLYFQPDRFREQYAADLPQTETKLLALTQRPMAERAMTEVSDVAAWKAIPSWFIFGTRDNSIPANLLSFMAERAGSKKTVTIEGASHAVMMSHADAVVELIEQAAAAVE